jgi:hypothetical protein
MQPSSPEKEKENGAKKVVLHDTSPVVNIVSHPGGNFNLLSLFMVKDYTNISSCLEYLQMTRQVNTTFKQVLATLPIADVMELLLQWIGYEIQVHNKFFKNRVRLSCDRADLKHGFCIYI